MKVGDIKGWLETVAGVLQYKLFSHIKGLILGADDDYSLTINASGHLVMSNEKTGKRSIINGNVGAVLQAAGAAVLHISPTEVQAFRDVQLRSGKGVVLHKADNSETSTIKRNGDIIDFANSANLDYYRFQFSGSNGYQLWYSIFKHSLNNYCSLGEDGKRFKASFANAQYVGYHDIANAAYTVTNSNHFIINTVNLTADREIELPSAQIAISGWTIIVRQAANNGHNLTITPEGGETIDGNPSYIFTAADGIVRLISDGTNMVIAGEN